MNLSTAPVSHQLYVYLTVKFSALSVKATDDECDSNKCSQAR